MGEIQVFRADQWNDLLQTLNQSFRRDFGTVLLLDSPLSFQQAAVIKDHAEIVCFATGTKHFWGANGDWPPYIQGFIADPHDKNQILWALEQARLLIDLKHENEQLRLKMRIEIEKSKQLLIAALELANERETSRLCDRVLTIIRQLTQAEGASLYLADTSAQTLRLTQVQNEKIEIKAEQLVLKLDGTSMAGACAERKTVIHVPDVSRIPPTETFRFNDSLDRKLGYKTISALCIPLMKSTDELVGVIQLINSKRSFMFSDEDIEVGKALSAHIAVSLETALLYKNIEDLLDGFIRASVTAIESRDLTTSGHSERVAKLSVGLAQEVSLSNDKPFVSYRFTDNELRQLNYASLLHDFGKIGVPERVLLKEKKLYPEELREISLRVKLLKVAYPDRAEELDQLLKSVTQANEPTVLFEKLKNDLSDIVGKTWKVLGEEFPLLTNAEWQKLSVGKGSLTIEDREQIESHVTHTYRFLKQIPWTRNFQNLPDIAFAHHEKLDGTGYPRKLKQEQIPFESQIMAVADIYDALTASDRPYKKALPREKALEILFSDAKNGKLNLDLVELFKGTQVFLRIENS